MYVNKSINQNKIHMNNTIPSTERAVTEMVAIETSRNDNPVLVYYGPNHPNGYAVGTRVIRNFIRYDLLEPAFDLIRKEYPKEYQESAINDFMVRVRAIVNRIYKGDIPMLKWLKGHKGLILKNPDIFRRAADEIKKNGKEFPVNLDIEGAEDIIEILKGTPADEK